MNVIKDYRLMLKHEGKWLVISYAWEPATFSCQEAIYNRKSQTYKIQKRINGRFKDVLLPNIAAE